MEGITSDMKMVITVAVAEKCMDLFDNAFEDGRSYASTIAAVCKNTKGWVTELDKAVAVGKTIYKADLKTVNDVLTRTGSPIFSVQLHTSISTTYLAAFKREVDQRNPRDGKHAGIILVKADESPLLIIAPEARERGMWGVFNVNVDTKATAHLRLFQAVKDVTAALTGMAYGQPQLVSAYFVGRPLVAVPKATGPLSDTSVDQPKVVYKEPSTSGGAGALRTSIPLENATPIPQVEVLSRKEIAKYAQWKCTRLVVANIGQYNVQSFYPGEYGAADGRAAAGACTYITVKAAIEAAKAFDDGLATEGDEVIVGCLAHWIKDGSVAYLHSSKREELSRKDVHNFQNSEVVKELGLGMHVLDLPFFIESYEVSGPDYASAMCKGTGAWNTFIDLVYRTAEDNGKHIPVVININTETILLVLSSRSAEKKTFGLFNSHNTSTLRRVSEVRDGESKGSYLMVFSTEAAVATFLDACLDEAIYGHGRNELNATVFAKPAAPQRTGIPF
jgi:hypothetical protein